MARHSRLFAGAALILIGCAESPTTPSAVLANAGVARVKAFGPGEQQPTAIASDYTLAIYPEGVGQVLQQTFTPSSHDVLGYIWLPVGCSSGVLLNVKLRDGLNGPIIYEANVLGLPEIVDGSFSEIQLYNPAVNNGQKLKKGHTYAFELAAFPGPSASGNTCGIAHGPVGDPYAGGHGYYQDPINGPAFLPLGATDDLPFITFVR